VRRIISTFVVAAAGALLVAAAPAGAAATADRLAGPTRYETAVVAATAAFASATDAVVARGDTFPDALAASALAGSVDGPILLTEPHAVPAATRGALARLGVRRVHVVGDETAVGADVEAALRTDGYEVRRYGGATRYDTAARVADAVGAAPALDGKRTVFVASGESFADALAAGPVAFSGPYPLLLTARAALSPAAADSIRRLTPERVVLLGGLAAVSGDVERALHDLAPEVHRYGGRDRSETAALVAWLAHDQLGWPNTEIDLARGDLFPDALAAAPHAARHRAPVLLTSGPTDLGVRTRLFLEPELDRVAAFHVLGDQSAISDTVVDAARTAATKGAVCPPPSQIHTGQQDNDPRICVTMHLENHTAVTYSGSFRGTVRIENRSGDTIPLDPKPYQCAISGALFTNGESTGGNPDTCPPPITALAPHEVRTYDFVLDTCNGGTVNSCFEGYSVVGLFDAAVGLVAGGPDVYRQVQYPVQQPVLVFE
jgi:putative cell wall-binding protein